MKLPMQLSKLNNAYTSYLKAAEARNFKLMDKIDIKIQRLKLHIDIFRDKLT